MDGYRNVYIGSLHSLTNRKGPSRVRPRTVMAQRAASGTQRGTGGLYSLLWYGPENAGTAQLNCFPFYNFVISVWEK